MSEKEDKLRDIEREKVRKEEIENFRESVRDKGHETGLSRDIEKMQAPDEWPDPPKKKDQ